MFVVDGNVAFGCLTFFVLCFFLLFGFGIELGNWLRLDNPMWGSLVVFSALWWFIRYRRKKEKEKSRRYIEGLEDYDD